MNNNQTNKPTLKTDEILINVGPQHPSTHGVLRLVARTDGEWVRETHPHIGYLHRCAEKIAENLTYKQFVPYTDRLDYLASINNNVGFCLAVEKIAEIEVPERAAYLRVIGCEINRIASHLISYGTIGMETGAFTPFFYGFREREQLVAIIEKMCGARLTHHYARIGGVMRDINSEIEQDIRDFVRVMNKRWDEYNTLLSFNEIFIQRTANIGIIPPEMAIEYGLTGPCLRGSGVAWDLRKCDPYSLYDRFDFNIALGEGKMGTVGDSWDRYWVRMVEIKESLKIITQALDTLPQGDIMAKVPRVLKLPQNEVYVRVENPRGELGFYLVSEGDTKPYRLKIRSPSFCNLSITDAIAKDCLVADVIIIVGSIDIVLGEVDR
jgi:NADH-quinone oxidoreductase subunit D